MIETTIPEINVSELMSRVRVQAAEIERKQARAPRAVAAGNAVNFPAVGEAPALPPLALPRPVQTTKGRIAAAFEKARRTTQMPAWVPKLFRGLFRKQGAYNRNLLETARLLVKANAELTQRVEQLTACLAVQQNWLQQMHEQSPSQQAWRSAVEQTFVRTAADLRAEMERELESANASVRGELESAHALVHGELESLQATVDRELQDTAVAISALHAEREEDHIHLQNLQTQAAELRHGFAELRAHGEQRGEHLQNLQQEVDRTAEIAANLETRSADLWQGFQAVRANGERFGEHLSNLQKQADGSVAAVHSLQARVADLSDAVVALRHDGEKSGEHLRNVQIQADRNTAAADGSAQALGEMQKLLSTMRLDAERLGQHVRNLQVEVERQSGVRHEIERGLELLDERFVNDTGFLRGEISQQRALMQHLLVSGTRTSKLSPSNAARKKAAPVTDGGLMDAFYVNFENRFRGKRSEIKERVRFYLPLITAAAAGSAERPVLDVGCGRGEWLELLRENDLQGTGVDLNQGMVQQCKTRKLAVVHGDAIEHLRSLPAGSQGAVSGFHVIEHLPFETLMVLLAETLRVLQPGGVAIFESPNCKNLVVGASNFNIDPTHRNPVFPDTAEFMLSLTGFERTRLEYLSPVEGSPFGRGNAESAFLDDRLFGPQDFAVIGFKPAQG